jgi:hypothetical protein
MNQMMFTSIKKNNPNNPNITGPTVVQPTVITRRTAFSITPNISPQSVPIVTNNQITEKKMKWGPSIWFFFHTLAEKVKEEEFLSIRGDIINNILLICKNLPCPNCASHATDYMSKINFNVIRTKDDLKTLLFTFHNSVNQKKGYPIFTRHELDDKYSKAVTINIFNNFLITFQDKHKSIRMISDDMYRQRLSVNLRDWFISNINKFYQ